MAIMSNYLEDQLIKHIFRTGTFSKPTVLAFALLTTEAIDSDTGQFSSGTGVEVVSGSAYSRFILGPSNTLWSPPVSGNGETFNGSSVAFNIATGPWGNIVGLTIIDNAVYDTGNMLFFTTVDTPREINTGDKARFAATQLVFKVD